MIPDGVSFPTKKFFDLDDDNDNNNNKNNNNSLPWAYHQLRPAVVIIRIYMELVSIVFFFLQAVASAPLPSNILTDDTLARYE